MSPDQGRLSARLRAAGEHAALLDAQAPPPALPGGPAEHALVTRVRFLAFRRPVLKAVVAAALLAPAVGHDPLEDVDRPFVLVLEVLVAWLLVVAYGRLRSGRGPQVQTKPDAPQIMAIWCLISGLGLVAGLVAVFSDVPGTSTTSLLLQALAVIGSFLLVLRVQPSRADPDHDSQAPVPQPSGFDASMGEQPAFSGTAIACSGGGIRSAAFCLGGLQRLRQNGNGGSSLYADADRVYAVSGGGYIATALHMARRHSDQDAAVQESLFQPGSPEEDWLRRRSKFLLPTGSTMVSGVLSHPLRDRGQPHADRRLAVRRRAVRRVGAPADHRGLPDPRRRTARRPASATGRRPSSAPRTATTAAGSCSAGAC